MFGSDPYGYIHFYNFLSFALISKNYINDKAQHEKEAMSVNTSLQTLTSSE